MFLSTAYVSQLFVLVFQNLKPRLSCLRNPLSSTDLLFQYLQNLQDFIANSSHILLFVRKIFRPCPKYGRRKINQNITEVDAEIKESTRKTEEKLEGHERKKPK